MNIKQLPFFERKEDTIYFNGYRLDIYIPKMYFDSKIAEHNGSKIRTIGIFQLKYYKDENEVTKNKPRILQYNLPDKISFSFSEMNTYKEVNEDDEEETYEVYTLEKGDIFIENVKITQSAMNTEGLVKLHHSGRLPNNLRYSEIIDLYISSMKNNKISFNTPLNILEIVSAELARSKSNPEIAFRMEISKPNSKLTENDYNQTSITKLAFMNSTFTALTSENINQAIINSINKTHNDGVEKESPVEKTIKY